MRHRLLAIIPTYLLVFAMSLYAAFLLRFDFTIPHVMQELLKISLPIVLVLRGGVCYLFGDWRRSFRYATLEDLPVVVGSALTGSFILFCTNSLLFPFQALPRTVILIDFLLTVIALCSLRVASRGVGHLLRKSSSRPEQTRTLIYGVDDDSIAILRMLGPSAGSDSRHRVVGFIDPRNRTQSSSIGGIPVFSDRLGWAEIKACTNAQHVLIPGKIAGKQVRELLQQCRVEGLAVQVIPGVSELVDGRYTLGIRDVTISDLLRREPTQLDMQSIRHLIAGRRVMVTGGAGSIGSELCRQVLELEPESLIVLDQSEFGVFSIEREFAAREEQATVDVHYVLADITDAESIDRVMRDHQPELVFHAAAYKHVPLMEDNPQSAVHNNVLGTRTMVDAAVKAGVGRFVMISTDKAVCPTSVMGATKFLAERYLLAVAAEAETDFVTVRFGNVLNSVGSVVPTFRKQIEAGGPVTVTHPDMERFFMTIPEAVQLVLQAGAIGESGNVLILDMGEPVKIIDLAEDLIMLSGLQYPEDIEIVFTGMRPGEKLYEELFYETEHGGERIHDKIHCGNEKSPRQPLEVRHDIVRLIDTVYDDRDVCLATLRETVELFAEHQLEAPAARAA